MRSSGFAATVVALALCTPVLADDEPRFVDGDAGALSVRVVKTWETTDRIAASLALLEVRNPTARSVEPLSFECVPPGPKRGEEPQPVSTVTRVPAPDFGRAGRAVPARGKESYLVLLPLDPKAARKAKLRVVGASYFEGPAWTEPPVKAGRPKVEKFNDPTLGRTIGVTRIEIENLAPYEVDAVFRAKFKGPEKGEGLVRCRVEAGRTFEWEVRESPLHPSWTYSGAEITKLELVDWSVVRDDGAEAARRGVAAAFAARVGWDAAVGEVRGRFLFRPDEGGRLEGSFVVAAGGDPVPEPDESLVPAQAAAVREALASAFAPLRVMRPPADGYRLHARAGDRMVVHVEDGSFVGRAQPVYVELDGARVVATYYDASKRNPRTTWHARSLGASWVLARRTVTQGHEPSVSHDESWSWTVVDGVTLPSGFREYERWGGARVEPTVNEIELTELVVSREAGPPPAPTGTGVEALRAAWDGVYRYPTERVGVTGSFAIETPGTAAEWYGEREVTGTFHLEGFGRGRWERIHVEVDARKGMSDGRAEELGDAVADRFLMWIFREQSALETFDRAFAGATVEADGSGFVLENAAYSRVDLAEGRPGRLVLARGVVRSLRYASIGGLHVVERIETGREVVTIRQKRVAEGWILPARVEFRDVFVDWGPEVLTLSKVRVRGAGG